MADTGAGRTQTVRNPFTSRAFSDAIILTAFCLCVLFFAVQNDAFEALVDYVADHEEYQLDELILALATAGIGSLIYAALRVVELARALNAKERAESDTAWLAEHDPLTHLHNRRGLDAAVAAMEANGTTGRYTVHSIDLDGFKKINDLLGHEAGDQALFEVARRLGGIYGSDALFRVGGDEFVVLQGSTDAQAAQAKASAAVAALSEPFALSGTTAEIGASIGIASVPKGKGGVRTALQHADAAMYVAKRGGRNQTVWFEPSMKDALRHRIELERDLRSALREHVVVPYFQPLVDLKSGKVHGFEALARWERNGEFLPAMEFIALAEETGLIVELTDQLLRRASIEAKSWPNHVNLAFNISPVQFRDPQLGLRIIQILGETGLPPHRLEIEITETALVQDLHQADITVSTLHAAGIRVALDDFGTGYSSLSQLSRFNFDKIKIDRSFVEGFETDERQAKIVRAVLGLGRGLGLTMTAEGIESESQLKALTELGCDVGQGFLFGRAMPADDARRLCALDTDTIRSLAG
ncbi:EAL domain-containing protein [Ciceribacter sp. L1K22]|nr:EAL domain-containing protein [Ciceribacter sp. L1K22]